MAGRWAEPMAATVGLLVLLAGVAGVVALADVDGDGPDTKAELQAGTDPFAADTDGDGLDDGTELRVGTDPTSAHSDGDSLPDGAEVTTFDTDPTAVPPELERLRSRATGVEDGQPVDTDGDGLDDGAELAVGTDPTQVDTDGDRLEDGPEFHLVDTDPLDADTDDDGLDDGREIRLETDPLDADTDGDGLADGREANLGTDPLDADTDGDGLDDGLERAVGTSPTRADTDGDGLPDGAELTRPGLLPGADPLRKDVYVEMDWMEGHRPSGEAVAAVEGCYARAPVSNPDGSTGIAVHPVWSEQVPLRSPLSTTAGNGSGSGLSGYAERYFDRRAYGYHYVLFVDEVSHEKRSVGGVTALGDRVVAVSSQEGPAETGSTFMHELGHSLGLRGFRGIDSEVLSMSTYPSVMNYNAPPEYYGYSEGTGPNDHDDWKRIDESLGTAIATDGLDATNASARDGLLSGIERVVGPDRRHGSNRTESC